MSDVTLDVQELVAQRRVSLELLSYSNLTAREVKDEVYDSLVCEVRYRVATQKFEPVVAKWPADWWQALKARWFPAWALRRWPAQMRHLRVDPMAFYPQIALRNEPHVVYLNRKSWVDDGDDAAGEEDGK